MAPACRRMAPVVLLFAAILVVTSGMPLEHSRKLMRHSCAPCGDVYVVREGETLQTISEKCHAPFILLDNPQIQDTDDVSAGSVLKIASTKKRCHRSV